MWLSQISAFFLLCIHEVLRKFVSKNKTNHPISSINLPLATANKAIHCIKWGGGGGWGLVKNQREHHIILTKYDAVHPAVVSGKNVLIRDANNFDKREKGRDLTRSHDKSPYISRNVKRAEWQHKQRHKKFDNTAVADRQRTVSWSNYGHPTGVVNLVFGPKLPTPRNSRVIKRTQV